jgi:hypothetical protein
VNLSAPSLEHSHEILVLLQAPAFAQAIGIGRRRTDRRRGSSSLEMIGAFDIDQRDGVDLGETT